MKNRGLQDILIAVVDGLKGFPEAITAAFPETMVQTCIVHLVRHSLNFCSWKDRKAVAADLRRIYEAATADMAITELDAFEEKWAAKYASIAPAWRRAWQELIPFFAFDPTIRKIIYIEPMDAIGSSPMARERRRESEPGHPEIHQDARLVPNGRGRHEADLSGDPKLRERWAQRPGMVCGPQPVRHNVRRALRRLSI